MAISICSTRVRGGYNSSERTALRTVLSQDSPEGEGALVTEGEDGEGGRGYGTPKGGGAA